MLYSPAGDVFDAIAATYVVVESMALSTAIQARSTIDADEVFLAICRIPVETIVIPKHTLSFWAFETEESCEV
jgi:hypothetical protein